MDRDQVVPVLERGREWLREWGLGVFERLRAFEWERARGVFERLRAFEWERARGVFEWTRGVLGRKPMRGLLWALGILLCLKTVAWLILPAPLFDAPYSRILLSNRGELLAARIAADHQWRFPCCIKTPQKYEAALLAFEDKRFFWHPGVDPAAVLRALRLNIKQGRIVSGGSTLTMQTARLLRGNPERTFGAKFLEVLLSILLELHYDKSEIMEFYAAHAPFGGNIVGLETAAWRYFGRPPARLSWAESALLAVLPNSPALIHPGRNRSLLRAKRDRLLRTLQSQGLLDEIDLQLALAEPLPAKPGPLPRLAPHLLDSLVAGGGRAGRARFESTLDFRLQKQADDILNRQGNSLASRRIGNGALLVVDNRLGTVVAYVGNRRAGSAGGGGLAVDLIQRPRSTGSILKPFLFGAMLKDGEILSNTLVADVPVRYQGFKPNNFDRKFRGAVPAKMALARSLNVPSVRMLHDYGVRRFYDFLKSLGMSTLFRSADGYGLSLVLGGAEGLLFDVTQMYAGMAALAEGRRAPRLRRLMDEPRGFIDTGNFGPGAAFLTLEALVEVTRPDLDNFWRSFSSSRKIAWKTGTSYGLRDAWAVGVTPRYTVGVWAGNADGEGVAGLSGVSSAAPILFDMFRVLENGPWFSPPWDDLTEFQVCRDNGLLPAGPCVLETVLAPAGVSFTRQSNNHKLIHLDRERKWRVHSDCESTANMRHETWFVLPPAQAFYFKKFNPTYKSPPPFRPDCLRESGRPITLLYPTVGARIFIPRNLKGDPDGAVFQAAHANPGTVIFWHLNETYLGKTKRFHQISVQPEPGRHKLTLVDQRGNRVERWFEVLE